MATEKRDRRRKHDGSTHTWRASTTYTCLFWANSIATIAVMRCWYNTGVGVYLSLLSSLTQLKAAFIEWQLASKLAFQLRIIAILRLLRVF